MTGVSECSQQRGNLKDDGYTSTDLNALIKLSLIKNMRLIDHHYC
ncbi:hypothetical protein [Photorhabdus laumondii]